MKSLKNLKSSGSFTLLLLIVTSFYEVQAQSIKAIDGDSVKDRIVGGLPASENEFPYQLRILVSGRNRTSACGASIITSKYALTAAHCLRGNPRPRDVKLFAGFTDLRQRSGLEYETVGAVLKLHPSYNAESNVNDIALIKIQGTFNSSSGIRPIKLATSRSTIWGKAVAAGWGRTKEGGNSSSVLQKVLLPIQADSECEKVYRSLEYNPRVMICAGGGVEGGKDTCQGDSGGPLVLNDVQIGIVSYGIGCGRSGLPGVYTRVSAYMRWIETNLK